MTPESSITVNTPAKINLGLEILGKREDGYHEIRTVMAAIDLSDTLRITQRPSSDGIRVSGVPDVRTEDNIIARAADVYAEATGIRFGLDIEVQKRIPSPGGLGGASANAAGTLLALDAMFETELPATTLQSLASRLGSDVPFFLVAPCALASGTGTDLQPLPPVDAAVVIVTPPIGIAAKTAALYGALRPGDFSDGAMAETVAQSVMRGEMPTPDVLRNAFTRSLYELDPSLAEVAVTMKRAGAPSVALTGAGPGHYALLESIEEARALADELRQAMHPDVRVDAARFLTGATTPIPRSR